MQIITLLVLYLASLTGAVPHNLGSLRIMVQIITGIYYHQPYWCRTSTTPSRLSDNNGADRYRTLLLPALLVSYSGQAFGFRTHQSGLSAKNPYSLVRSQSGLFDRSMPDPNPVPSTTQSWLSDNNGADNDPTST